MARRVRALLALALVSLPLGGCHTDSVYWWGNHMKGYSQVVRRDAEHVYRSFDRHFMNYDWDDPYID
ncbi:MAG: hypothetical protein IPH13_07860 [Planctomycetes bacterium]|nr:hypothetical protein [Planctomycetota bacterium]MCC7172961.1 hypothetical protein [Planctomycetota bacterium]